MSTTPLISLNTADKVFHTRHFMSRKPDTDRRVFYHKRTVHAVNSVSFDVQPGEIFGLLGPNGAGKTTIVKMLSGLVRPSSGTVWIDGIDVSRKRLKALGTVGVVLEGTRTSIWPLTPLENLAYFGNLKGVRGKLLKERARFLVDFIGLKEKADVQVRYLSRGQKQKLAICIALIADPKVLLLDEPTTGLDVQSSRSIKDKIVEMARAHGKSVLVTTHDMHVAQELCGRIGIIKQGALAACKPTEELLEIFGDRALEIRLDKLPTNGLLDGIPGVEAIEYPDAPESEPICLVTLEPDQALRSEAIYEVLERFRRDGLQLRGVTQRQSTLESVFLKVTEEESSS